MKKKEVIALFVAIAIVATIGVVFMLGRKPAEQVQEPVATETVVDDFEEVDEVVEQATPTPEVIQATPEPTVQPTQTPEPTATPEVEDEDPIGTVLTEEETTEEAVEPTATPEAVAEKPAEKPVEAPKQEVPPVSNPDLADEQAELLRQLDAMGAVDISEIPQGTSTNRKVTGGQGVTWQ